MRRKELRDSVKLNKIQKSEKNSEVGRSVKPQLGLTSPSFSRIF